MKKCPYCAEEIQDEASKCRYCGERLPAVAPNPTEPLSGQTLHSPVSTPKKPKKKRGCLSLILGGFFLVVILGLSAIFNSNQSTDAPPLVDISHTPAVKLPEKKTVSSKDAQSVKVSTATNPVVVNPPKATPLNYLELALKKRNQPLTVTTTSLIDMKVQFGVVGIPVRTEVKLRNVYTNGSVEIEFQQQSLVVEASKTDLEQRVKAICDRRVIYHDVEYEGVSFKKINPCEVNMFHSGGIIKVAMADLPPEAQVKAGYDPVEAKQYVEKMKKFIKENERRIFLEECQILDKVSQLDFDASKGVTNYNKWKQIGDKNEALYLKLHRELCEKYGITTQVLDEIIKRGIDEKWEQGTAEPKSTPKQEGNQFVEEITSLGINKQLVDSVKVTNDKLTIVVANGWHSLPYQVRLQAAQGLWRRWANIHSPENPDTSRIKITDYNGNEVGGSSWLGGSGIWVDK